MLMCTGGHLRFRRLIMTLAHLAVMSGCASLDPRPKIDEASELVRSRTGVNVDFNMPWETGHSVWTAADTLTLDQALNLAMQNNRDLRADLTMIGQANADLVQAGLLSNPAVNFMVMFPSGGGRAMLRSNALPMQPLQDLWLIPAKQEVAQAELQKAVLRFAQRAVDVVAAVKRAYAEVQFNQRAAELIAANIELVKQSTDIIGIRQGTGKATLSELNLSRIRHQRLRSDLLAVEAELRSSKHELLMLVGQADASIVWHVEPPSERDVVMTGPAPEEELLRVAADQRLDLKAAEWNAEAALRRVDLTRREGWPDLSAGFTFERAPSGRSRGVRRRYLAADAGTRLADVATNGIDPREVSRSSLERAATPGGRRDVKYLMGPMIEMELPIFDWNQAQTARALYEHQQRLAEYEGLLQTTAKEVRRALAKQEEAMAQVRLFGESIIPDVERNMELSRQTYMGGQTDLTIYLQAQEDVITTRYKLLEYVRNYHSAEADLERAVGGRLPAAQLSEISANQGGTKP